GLQHRALAVPLAGYDNRRRRGQARACTVQAELPVDSPVVEHPIADTVLNIERVDGPRSRFCQLRETGEALPGAVEDGALRQPVAVSGYDSAARRADLHVRRE